MKFNQEGFDKSPILAKSDLEKLELKAVKEQHKLGEKKKSKQPMETYGIKYEEPKYDVMSDWKNLVSLERYGGDISEENEIGSYLKSFDFKPEDKEEIGDDFRSFEEENILFERIKKFKKEKEERKKKEEEEYKKEKAKREIYTLDDFRTMEEFYRYQMLMDKIPMTEKNKLEDKQRPLDAKGKPFTDDEIKELTKDWFICKKNNKWGEYSQFDLNFMKKCAVWEYFHKQLAGKSKYPTLLGGAPATQKQIDRMVEDYKKLKDENPKLFAELKVKNGEWLRGKFFWREEKYKGKKQYVGYERAESADEKTGKKITKENKYVLTKIPDGFAPTKIPVMNYFVPKGKIETKNSNLIFAELRPPYAFQEAVAA